MVEGLLPVGWDLRLMARLRKGFYVAGFLTILAAVPCGWLLARRGLVHVKKIDRAARSIATGSDLMRRVPVR
ncbi:hypothetical protein SAMN02746041_02339 [Desulfacinum hydrothermale DSM 13146]|uniref:Uncharacterized protein n=1 Tax=Desulfacinum hydrothermale DSM 13146 TaxID=1121390 RepID=A0A1W1XPN0_9BACT|nr:hypothetical protein [Desulfacinum hydrothermale]SMC25468.1 hypothetical protein SAMN02746041_02339 [Desulfacinum hydrothermale DSM 13146]